MTIYLDTETTGLAAGRDEVLQIGIVDDSGAVLMNTLIKPVRNTTWPEAQDIHGITPQMVASAPTLDEVLPTLTDIVRGQYVVIYNANFDCAFLPIVGEVAASVECCMLRFAEWYGAWSDWHESYTWQKLSTAAKCVDHALDQAHDAVADSLACRAVWRYLNDPAERERVRIDREEKERLEREYAPVRAALEQMAEREKAHEYVVQEAAETVLWRRLQLRPYPNQFLRFWSADDERPMDEDDYAQLFFGQSIWDIRREEWRQTPVGKLRTRLDARKATLQANTKFSRDARANFIRKGEWPNGGMTETQIFKAKRENEKWTIVGYGLSGGSRSSQFEYWIYLSKDDLAAYKVAAREAERVRKKAEKQAAKALKAVKTRKPPKAAKPAALGV